MPPIKVQVSRAAVKAAWLVSKTINDLLPDGERPHPGWAPRPLLKSSERLPKMTGVPRKTESLCPDCNRDTVEAILRGKSTVADFRKDPGIIRADIVEEAGRILMRKACERHGPFEDLLSCRPEFFRKMEALAFGSDFECVGDEHVHNHGVNAIKTGRGIYLIIDLTTRCNMACSPCFMNANALSYVHELDLDDVKAILDRTLSFTPRRDVNVLFSGGEPTLSPIFLDAIRQAKTRGFHRIHVSTNGIAFAQTRTFAEEAKAAGLHAVYLQFDGVSELHSKHRGLGNHMPVKYQALENIAATGMKTTLQVTVSKGTNQDGIGDIVRFAIRNLDKIQAIVFQPLMFCGRDENTSDHERYARRYPLSELPYDLQEQISQDWQPMRDWLPLSAYGIFAHLSDVLNPSAKQGSLFNDIHPDHGIFSPLLIDTETLRVLPLGAIFDVEGFLTDVVKLTDSGRGPKVTRTLVSLSLMRNFKRDMAPNGFGIPELRQLLRDCFERVSGDANVLRQADSYHSRWRLLMINGMWFQDLLNYDLSTMSTSGVAVASQGGEISFSAHNGGRWRRIVEHLYQTATLNEWHRTHPRHPIYAKGRPVILEHMASSPSEFVQIENKASAAQVSITAK